MARKTWLLKRVDATWSEQLKLKLEVGRMTWRGRGSGSTKPKWEHFNIIQKEYTLVLEIIVLEIIVKIVCDSLLDMREGIINVLHLSEKITDDFGTGHSLNYSMYSYWDIKTTSVTPRLVLIVTLNIEIVTAIIY